MGLVGTSVGYYVKCILEQECDHFNELSSPILMNEYGGDRRDSQFSLMQMMMMMSELIPAAAQTQKAPVHTSNKRASRSRRPPVREFISVHRHSIYRI